MSVLSSGDVLHLATLAKLKLTKKEEESLKSQLSNVISFFSELQKVRTVGIDPTSQTTGLSDVLRDDEINVNANLPVNDSLSGTDNVHNDYFVVSAVIDKDK